MGTKKKRRWRSTRSGVTQCFSNKAAKRNTAVDLLRLLFGRLRSALFILLDGLVLFAGGGLAMHDLG